MTTQKPIKSKHFQLFYVQKCIYTVNGEIENIEFHSKYCELKSVAENYIITVNKEKQQLDLHY